MSLHVLQVYSMRLWEEILSNSCLLSLWMMFMEVILLGRGADEGQWQMLCICHAVINYGHVITPGFGLIGVAWD